MIISHNLQAMNTNRIVNANISAHGKSTRKVSSGYKINLPVDNPVGLAMSETMRRQIRGLMQGTNNTRDAIAFVQIADGAMSEIHDMLQRMNELALRSLNGLYTDSDRAALNAEFDQLRTEIDRINDNTALNELPVFEEHEASYYQICGNRQWSDNQLHTITESKNELNIHLPDGYEPKDYTITVPAGVYTTQELMDEIDDALHKMSPPNPGFILEYTSDGYCNLNFESADGKPTKIESVDGSLAYLIYDFETGGSPATLLGTTIFGFNPNGTPSTLSIYTGYNDELGFYAESAEGSQYISIKLDATPSGKPYTRDELINEINSKLDEVAQSIPIAANIRAEAYGEDGKSFIQITGGDTINIVGLKGNMFRYETNTSKYTSVFYDNALYGNCTKYPASITGNPHANQYPITITNNNNILKFKVNDETEYTITIPTGSKGKDYTIADLVKVINDQLGPDAEITASGTTSLTLINKLSGTKSTLDFKSYFSENPVYENAYESIFCMTSGDPYIQSGWPASLLGAATLSGSISLAADAYLSFNINGKPYTISNLGGTYTNLGKLLDKLNDAVDKMDIKGKIEFKSSGNRIQILSKSSDVRTISITDKNDTYIQLFTGEIEVTDGGFSSTGGSSTADQGQTVGTNVPATTTSSSCQQTINITNDTNKMTFTLNHGLRSESKTITLKNGSYSVEDLVAEIRNKLGSDAANITVSNVGSSIKFEYTPSNPAIGDKWSIGTSGSAWNAVFGTKKQHSQHTSTDAQTASLTSFPYISDSVTINSSNNTFNLKLEIDGKTISDKLVIPNGTYTRETLKDALQTAINKSKFKNTVTAEISGKRLVLNAPGGTFSGSGNFYVEVMCKGEGDHRYPSNGRYTYTPDTRIIGRTDLTKEPVKIVKDVNDQLTFDFTYPGSSDHLEMTITLPAGEYQNGVVLFGDKEHPNEELKAFIEKQIEQYDRNDPYYDEIQRLFGKNGCFDLNFSIGGYKTNAANNVDESALQISVTPRKGADVPDPDAGQYILDGVRGNAAPFVFYKTTSLPTASYIIGTKNVMDGITIEPGKNVLTLSANSVPYQYTFPENTFYTADELIDLLNSKFKNGDDFGNPAPLRASLENGAVKISHKIFGANTITDIGGSARSTIFFEEEGRDSRDPLVIQVGSEQRETIEIPRILVNSCSLGINSITVSQMKYAEKAVERIKEAINLLSTKRSTYGAMQNRLEHTVINNENVTESVQKTESGIRDTDLSSEMIRYSNLSILLQAGQEMIAQANKNIEKILSILQ